MLEVTTADESPLTVDADIVAVPVFKGGIEGPGTEEMLGVLGLDAPPVTPDFRGDIGQHLLLATGRSPVGAVLFVGLGRMDETGPERLRRAAGVAARAAHRFPRVATTLAEVHATDGAVQAVAEGFLLASAAGPRFKQHPDESALAQVRVLVPSSQLSRARAAVERAKVYARATVAARDLVNLPPDRKRPGDLAARITELVSETCDVTVHDEGALRAGGFGGLLGVGRGSAHGPRMVELRYRPAEPLGHVVLAGKGITFDTGGLSLKRGTSMNTMKSDMAGAAAVAAACSALAALRVRLEVTGLLALAENMPGGDAQRPGDILTVHGGKTVEVLDTDAEGRLVLADVLDLGASLRPEAMVDLATLTGSVIAALGAYTGGIMGNDEELVNSLRQAAAVAGESLWQLPLPDDLDHFLDSPVADVNNTGDGPGAGAVMGGLFLRRFVGDVAWAHLDIAGPAFLEKGLARDYLLPGGTGYGVRTLLAWLERRAD